MSSNVYALLIWYDDNPITGNVMNISAVSVPRNEYTDYRIGDAVKARCGSFGVVPAIIGKIGDKDEKKDMERLLKTPEAFSTLIDSLPEILVMRNISQNEPTYNGYLKSQVLDLLDGCKDFKKGTATVFRKIFIEEETRGRSLTGGIAKDGTRRLAIEDQNKIIFLIEVIKQKWPSTMNDAIKLVLRDPERKLNHINLSFL